MLSFKDWNITKRDYDVSAEKILSGTEPVLEGLKILIVDDEADTLDMLTIALEQYKGEVKAATSVAEALETFVQWEPDILVSDIGMPGEDGYDLIRRIRSIKKELEKKVPAIALTAYSRSEDRIKALSAGFQMHLSKPIDPAELAAVIASLTGRLKLMSQA
jgi:CheY-like chemotaxis protein